MTQQQILTEMEAAQQLVGEKYEAGVPFFTKELFRDVAQQIEAGHQRVAVPGLDGLSVRFVIETGKVRFHAGEDLVCVV